MTSGADADIERRLSTLTAMTVRVLVIGGVDRLRGALSTVSSYNIASDTWEVDLPVLNQARRNASACVLNTIVYVFCGHAGYGPYLNSIEVIK